MSENEDINPSEPKPADPIQQATDQRATDQRAADQRAADQRAADQQAADQPTPDQPTPDQPTPDQPTPDQPTPDQPTPDQPTPDQLATDQLATDQLATDQQTATQLATLEAEDRQIDLAISTILRTGVVVSSIVTGIGAIIYLVAHPDAVAHFQQFHGQPAELTTLPGIFHSASTGNGSGIMQAGVVLLLLTPIIRVAFSLFAFLKQRDTVYVVVALIVLSVLLFSLFGANIGGG